MDKVLVTGGAGFIGSHLVDRLVAEGYDVTVFDNLEPQVHGDEGGLPDYYNHNARFIKGDVRDMVALEAALAGIDIVFHNAAVVGVGQALYQVSRYTDVNILGTANLLDVIVNKYRDSIKKIIVSSSMLAYGEGLYECSACGDVEVRLRKEEQLHNGSWEQHCPYCQKVLKPKRTHETKRLCPTSVYGLSKKNQEELVITVGKNYNIPTVALRYFNVYGPRQALSNPYTGVCAIFLACLKNGRAPVLYEDGLQTRDFISVHDVVNANMRVLEHDAAHYQAFNIGTGYATTIVDAAQTLARLLGVEIAPVIEKSYRVGDIRHCVAEITKARELLGFGPSVSFDEGMRELVEWSKTAHADDKVQGAMDELKKRGLVRK